MRARLPVITLLGAMLAAAPRPAPAQPPPAPLAATPIPPPGPLGEREVTVANRSELSITELYISPTSNDAWGEDRLGDAILEPGKNLRLRLGRYRDCAFDLLAIYEDASRAQIPTRNLCRGRRVAFDGKNRIHPQTPTAPERTVSLVNQSHRAIQQVFISPADASQWGEDLLAHTISVGQSGEVTYLGACTVDLRVVFENRAAEERRGIDACATPALSIEPGWTTADEVPVPPGSGAF
ncbi:MAG: hypothetical protein IT555_00975 [Acetobacteraceae bacterium]|nr:hypothetical protein [Acetobacteraceae bacterium]